MFSEMFERADKFIAFPPYHFVALTIFSIVTAAYILVCPFLANMVTPSFFAFFQIIYPYRHFLKFL